MQLSVKIVYEGANIVRLKFFFFSSLFRIEPKTPVPPVIPILLVILFIFFDNFIFFNNPKFLLLILIQSSVSILIQDFLVLK